MEAGDMFASGIAPSAAHLDLGIDRRPASRNALHIRHGLGGPSIEPRPSKGSGDEALQRACICNSCTTSHSLDTLLLPHHPTMAAVRPQHAADHHFDPSSTQIPSIQARRIRMNPGPTPSLITGSQPSPIATSARPPRFPASAPLPLPKQEGHQVAAPVRGPCSSLRCSVGRTARLKSHTQHHTTHPLKERGAWAVWGTLQHLKGKRGDFPGTGR
jgi:hypothetical protein